MANKIKQSSMFNKSNIKKGILYGILPHSFCIAFIIFSIIGATALTALLKPLMLNAYFFHLLIVLSFVLATISALIYLKRNSKISIKEINKNKNYLFILYSSVIGINLILFLVVFPLITNLSFFNKSNTTTSTNLTSEEIRVSIPCSGHAPLIIDEVKKTTGVISVTYLPFDKFRVSYDPQKTTLDKILSSQIFKSFKATTINGN